jgi:hypothetical protein
MTVPIRGYDGKVTQGTADTALVWIKEWSADPEQEFNELKDFLNDSGNVYVTRGSRPLKGKFNGVVPSGKDASQTAVITAFTGGTDIKLTLVTVAGYSIVIAAAAIENIGLGHSGKDGPTFSASFRDNGGYTIA